LDTFAHFESIAPSTARAGHSFGALQLTNSREFDSAVRPQNQRASLP